MTKAPTTDVLNELRKIDTPTITNVVATYPKNPLCLGLYNPWSADCPRAQSAPRLTGCSGLPSSFVTRPSRVSAMMPQPAEHSRQVVA